jgi:hypothetical protein
MRKVIRALEALGYVVLTNRLSDEENAVWGSMVASATSAQQAINLLPEEKDWWQREVESESCLNCAYNGQRFCIKHD